MLLLRLFAVSEHFAIIRNELKRALNSRLSYFAISTSELMLLFLIAFACTHLICMSCMIISTEAVFNVLLWILLGENYTTFAGCAVQCIAFYAFKYF